MCRSLQAAKNQTRCPTNLQACTLLVWYRAWKHHRFEKVDLAGRRAAHVPRNSGMFGHVVGFVTNALVRGGLMTCAHAYLSRPVCVCAPLIEQTVNSTDDDAVDAPDDPASPFSRAKAALAAGDLLMAVREMDALDGLAKETARWRRSLCVCV